MRSLLHTKPAFRFHLQEVMFSLTPLHFKGSFNSHYSKWNFQTCRCGRLTVRCYLQYLTSLSHAAPRQHILYLSGSFYRVEAPCAPVWHKESTPIRTLAVKRLVKMHSLILLLWPITPVNSQNSSQITVDVLSFKTSTVSWRKAGDLSMLLGAIRRCISLNTNCCSRWRRSAIGLRGKCQLTMQINQAVITVRD